MQAGASAQTDTTTTQTQTDTSGSMQANAAATAGTMTAGGYQPAQPPMASPPAPGAPSSSSRRQPVAGLSGPAPLKSYPICKKGQYDQCRQRGGK